ncbi:MAG: hypothetical protein KDB53_08855, partial [Planctomycetes bacterium]|nr:hypothetical protein [Planctomycetota bacterium]
MSWQGLGLVSPSDLSDLRVSLHYGAILLGSASQAMLEAQDDHSHTNLAFDPRLKSLVGRPLVAAQSRVLALDLPRFRIVLRGPNRALSEYPLAGETMDRALTWIQDALDVSLTITPLDFPDLPESDLRDGGAFRVPSEPALVELASWFRSALELIDDLRGEFAQLSEARVWPHHFDLGALLPLSGAGERGLGIGFSPGDQHYDQPYFYCSPYPSPAGRLPELDWGHWHQDGFLSAILTAEALLGAESMEQAAREYVRSAIDAGTRL